MFVLLVVLVLTQMLDPSSADKIEGNSTTESKFYFPLAGDKGKDMNLESLSRPIIDVSYPKH